MKKWLIVLLILISGCATAPKGYWYNPNKTPAEARYDSTKCEGEARTNIWNQHCLGTIQAKVKGGKEGDKRVTIYDEYSRLMRERGYEFVESK